MRLKYHNKKASRTVSHFSRAHRFIMKTSMKTSTSSCGSDGEARSFSRQNFDAVAVPKFINPRSRRVLRAVRRAILLRASGDDSLMFFFEAFSLRHCWRTCACAPLCGIKNDYVHLEDDLEKKKRTGKRATKLCRDSRRYNRSLAR